MSHQTDTTARARSAGRAALALGAAASLAAAAAGQSFIDIGADLGRTGITSFVPDTGPPADVAWADYDGDGDLDLVVTGTGGQWVPGSPTSTRTTIYRNDGADTFTAISSVLPAAAGASVAWGDVDGDGDVDLAISGSNGGPGFTSVFENRGDGTFQSLFSPLPPVFSGSLDWGDVDLDGDVDVLLTGSTGNPYTRLLVNDGTGGLDVVDPVFVQVRYGDGELVDLDDDGDLDLVVSGETFGGAVATAAYRNDGGTWTELASGLPSLFSTSLDFGDVDGDGDLDAVIAGVESEFTEPTTTLLLNDGTGVFTDAGTDLVGIFNGSVRFGDVDGDGDLDLLVAGVNGVFSSEQVLVLYGNDGAGVFTPLAGTGLPDGPLAASWGDYDGDGDLDLVTVGGDATEVPPVRIFRNDAAPGATPAAPADLVASIEGDGTIALSWSAGGPTDGPLTWTVRVGTESGAMDVVSSETTGGVRLLAGRGTNDAATVRRLMDLEPGTYHWSVQATSAAGVSSPFAAESTFEITGGPIDADIDGSGVVDTADLLLLLAAWGQDPQVLPGADLDGDGVIGVEDLLLLLAAWG